MTMTDLVRKSRTAGAVLDTIVLPLFIFRMWIRIRMQRVGWEDIWATVAFVCGTVNIVSDWVYIANLGQSMQVATWIYMYTFTCLLWAVRISIIFSIIRIIPAKERLHIYGLIIIALFVLSFSALLVQDIISCTYAWHTFSSAPSNPSFRCSLIRGVSISELAVGAVADVIAVIYPLYVLRSVSLPPKKLRLLRLLFISSIVVSLICSLRMACQLGPVLAYWTSFVTHLQIAACLIVCNLLVVVTYLYRVLGYQTHGSTDDTTDKGTTSDDDSSTTPSPMTMTTIELFFSTQSGEGVSAATRDGTAPRLVSAPGLAPC